MRKVVLFCGNEVSKNLKEILSKKGDIMFAEDVNLADLIIVQEEFLSRMPDISNLPFTPLLIVCDYDYQTSLPELLCKNGIYSLLSKDSSKREVLDKVDFSLRVRSKLLEIQDDLRKAESERTRFEENIWELIDYAKFFLVVLDKDLNIRVCNDSLASILGLRDGKEAVGMNWLNFTPEESRESLKRVYSYLLSGDETHKEFVEEIVTATNEVIFIKWFNRLANGSLLLRVGVATSSENNSRKTIDDVRLYFKNVIEKDRTMIEVLKKSINVC